MAKGRNEEVIQETTTSADTKEEPVTNEVKEVPVQKVDKPTLDYIANNDTVVIKCPEGMTSVSGTFNGEKASGEVIDGIAHVKLSKELPGYYTYTID